MACRQVLTPFSWSLPIPIASLFLTPFAFQLQQLGVDADWLMFAPGMVDNGGSSGDSGVGYRIYKGLYGPPNSVVANGQYKPTGSPVWYGSFDRSDWIPWGDKLDLLVEIYLPNSLSVQPPTPVAFADGSFLGFTIVPFNDI